jgi:DNA polymerase-3 subunit alpha
VLEKLPLDDQAVYENVFRNANTTAVFQFESRGMKDMLVQAKPDRLEDLIALNALYRPGPMDLIPSFINRKHGREKVTYLTPSLEKVLSTTYGIMVYQEQVMQTAQVVAGYSLGGADMLRRAMGKKKPEEMAIQRQVFVEGAGKQGIDENTANEIFDYIDKFAGYGFNKSHAAAYSLVAYHTAWLKCHHPASFMAATLSSEMADTDKVQFFLKDGKDRGLTFLPPDINSGGVRFQPIDGKTIRYGLGAIKGTGEAALTCIFKARNEGGPFKDLFDFCKRLDKRVVNRRVIEALIKAGAFDSIDDHRAKLLASVGVALEAAEQAERNALQSGLFDMGDGGASDTEHYADVPRWSEREQLLQEKQALGFFLSGHPFNAFRKELSTFVKRPLGQLSAQKDFVLMAGVVLSTRIQMGRRGKMCILTLDDGTSQLEVVVYNELFEAERPKFKEDELLLLEGKVQDDAFSGGLRVTAEKAFTLAEARGRFARRLQLSLNGQADARKLQSLLAPYKDGPCRVRLSYRNATAQAEVDLSAAWRVHLDDNLLGSLAEWLTPDNVKVIYS